MPVTVIDQNTKEMSYIDNDNTMVINTSGNRQRISKRIMPTQQTKSALSTAEFPTLKSDAPSAPTPVANKNKMMWSQIASMRPHVQTPPVQTPPDAPKKPKTPTDVKCVRDTARTSLVAKNLNEHDAFTEVLTVKPMAVFYDALTGHSSEALLVNYTPEESQATDDEPDESYEGPMPVDEAPTYVYWGDCPADPVTEEDQLNWW